MDSPFLQRRNSPAFIHKKTPLFSGSHPRTCTNKKMKINKKIEREDSDSSNSSNSSIHVSKSFNEIGRERFDKSKYKTLSRGNAEERFRDMKMKIVSSKSRSSVLSASDSSANLVSSTEKHYLSIKNNDKLPQTKKSWIDTDSKWAFKSNHESGSSLSSSESSTNLVSSAKRSKTIVSAKARNILPHTKKRWAKYNKSDDSDDSDDDDMISSSLISHHGKSSFNINKSTPKHLFNTKGKKSKIDPKYNSSKQPEDNMKRTPASNCDFLKTSKKFVRIQSSSESSDESSISSIDSALKTPARRHFMSNKENKLSTISSRKKEKTTSQPNKLSFNRYK